MIVNIRYATMADLDDIASVESVCFPVLEAATKEEFEQRINILEIISGLCLMRV